MAITLQGRGYPLLLTVIDDGTLIWTLNDATTSAAFTSGAIVSASTFSATTFCGNSATLGTSAGGCSFEMSAAAAGVHLICAGSLNGTGAASGVSGNAVLVIKANGPDGIRNYYVPAFSAVAYA